MLKSIFIILISITSSLIFFFFPTPPKSFYHYLFLSPSFTSNASIANHLYTLTRRPHVAGTPQNSETADYVLNTLSSYSLKSHIVTYHVSLAYPLSRSLILTPQQPSQPIKFDLIQETYEGDPYAEVASEVMPTFHGFAKSGTASGPIVYVNYGRVEDYERLQNMGVNVSGSIVLAKYGQIYRGDIVRNAHEAGAFGAVLYTDRKDYGSGKKWFPEGRGMPPSGVQVGSVYTGLGDPTTPGWASVEECERKSDEEVESSGYVPLIPSLPVSWADGETILGAVGGQVADDDWQGSGDLTYRVGPGPGFLSLTYNAENVIAKIHDVFGVIEGEEEPDRFVLLGNHRDAWTFGAVDPNSGTAALLEIAERLWKLQKIGWKPRRTIILCNWDAEEYGLIGSTEWVEENREMLASRVVAYLNVDCAVSGPGFHAAATPQLDELLKQSAQKVQDPDNSSQNIYESWAGSAKSPTIERLGGGGSDYAAFLQHVGIPAADLFYGGGYPVYHSMYDDYVWMEKFGDPMFQRHVAVGSLWGLIALRLADDKFLPFNYLAYANELQQSTKDLEADLTDTGVSLVPMFKAIEKLRDAGFNINRLIKAIDEKQGWRSMWKTDSLQVREVNDRLMMAERAFTDGDGLFERQWYKHLIYGPSKHNDYGSKSFPGIDDAIKNARKLNTTESWRSVQHEVYRVSRAVAHAALVLNGKMT
ncbi:Peptidase M28 [Dillenia turbinata]|uniref:glutamate carboxypeptidase II n=1 Tax=Dillenia turbinata TaxID=194707 RepID=A0AAN8WAB4_9MAGN